MLKSTEFFHDGFGWICKRCDAERRKEMSKFNRKLPRYYREGEAESKQMILSVASAKWTDATRKQLICPLCGISEIIDLS